VRSYWQLLLTLEDSNEREAAVADAAEVLNSLQRRLRALHAEPPEGTSDTTAVNSNTTAVNSNTTAVNSNTTAVNSAKLADLEEWAANTVRLANPNHTKRQPYRANC
jgi:hypothetical protein